MIKLPANTRLWLVAAVLIAVLATLAWPGGNSCQDAISFDRNVQVNGHALKAELADNYAAQVKGLGGRPCIADDEAMLFSFSRPGYYPFWMRDMHFPIDIVWLSNGKRVVDVSTDVSPSSYPRSFSSSMPARYVLELKAGKAAKLHIVTGTAINF
jgi:uncharacterized membrane protein (UPF0127 family)